MARRARRALFALLVIAPTLSAQAAAKSPPPAVQSTSRTSKGIGYAGIDSVQLLTDLAAISADSMDGRRTGSAGNIRARAYILRQFLAASLSPFSQRFTFSFTVARQGGTTTAISSNNAAGTAGSFQLIEPTDTASVGHHSGGFARQPHSDSRSL